MAVFPAHYVFFSHVLTQDVCQFLIEALKMVSRFFPGGNRYQKKGERMVMSFRPLHLLAKTLLERNDGFFSVEAGAETGTRVLLHIPTVKKLDSAGPERPA